MYAKNTILELKEPRSDGDHLFPYDEVRVIGESPVSHHGTPTTKYTGADAKGVIIEPVTAFGSNADEPFGKLQALYNVKTLPEPDEVETQPKIRVIDSASAEAGETPEEVFAREAPGRPSEHGERVRTSPLPEPDAPADGPLGSEPK